MPISIWHKTLTGYDVSSGLDYEWTFDDAPVLDSGPDWSVLQGDDWIRLTQISMSSLWHYTGADDTVAVGYAYNTYSGGTPTAHTASDPYLLFDDAEFGFGLSFGETQFVTDLPVPYQTGVSNHEILRDLYHPQLILSGSPAGTADVEFGLRVEWVPSHPIGGVGWIIGQVAMG